MSAVSASLVVAVTEVGEGTGRAVVDTNASNVITEAIDKETRVYYKQLDKAEREGLVIDVDDREKQRAPSPLPQLPQMDNEQSMAFELSRCLWRSANPGYNVKAGPAFTCSSSKEDFQWRGEELDFFREMGMLDKKNNRTRDAFSQYVEASAQFKLLMKKAQG